MMEKLKFLILSAVLIGAVQCIDSRTGESPLYLTPLIEKGDIGLAKSKALVNNIDLLLRGVTTSYSGYLTVNKQYNSNLFFWFFPAKVNPSKAPVVLWLQGGPGASSLYGLFLENGPVSVNIKTLKLEKRQYSWNQNVNMLYIDNPVGAGFSFTDNPAGYLTNQNDIGNSLYLAVKQFFQLFPELRPNGFYATGESYAGKYIPALGHAIYVNRLSSDPNNRINLKGLAIGNGVSDPINQIGFGENMFQLGFIDYNALQIFNQYEATAKSLIQQRNFLGALQYTFSLINTPSCLFNTLANFTSPYNYLKQNGYDEDIAAVNEYIAKSGIANSLHVGTKTFTPFADQNIVLSYLVNDILDSVATWVAELANNYRVIIYSGQLDLLAGPTLTENYLSNLNFNAASVLKVAPRNLWFVDKELAGYVKEAENLTFLTVRLAGHLVPFDQPKWAYDILTKLITGKKFV